MSETAALISTNLHGVLMRIQQAAQACGREPSAIRLLAVSKTQPVAAIRAALASGQRHFGENYLQEALDKISALADADLVWHYIGAIQSNKTRPLAEHFAWVETLASAKHAQRLHDQRPAHLPPLNVCVQVNISAETQKAGISLAELPDLLALVARLPRLRLRGLMAIPAPADTSAAQRLPLRALAVAYQALQAQGYALDTLSMGMSDDLEAAVAEGSTQLRIGTAIFGQRQYPT